MTPTRPQDGSPAVGAVVRVSGRAKDVLTTTRGEWWRLLEPGTYSVTATLGGRGSREASLVVKEGGEGPRLDLRLVSGTVPDLYLGSECS